MSWGHLSSAASCFLSPKWHCYTCKHPGLLSGVAIHNLIFCKMQTGIWRQLKQQPDHHHKGQRTIYQLFWERGGFFFFF
jgi:hypothetical protein